MTNNSISHYRDEFPITQQRNFLSHAAVSPLSRRAAQAVQQHLERVQAESFMALLDEIMGLFHETSQRIAKLINAPNDDDIVLMPNTAMGINTAAVSLPLQPGDNVLILDSDYPANIYPWMNLAYKGVLTKLVPQHNGGLDLDMLEQRIDHRTRIIALSTVMFASGFRNDIAAVGKICQERGLFFVVDGIQSLGAFPLDVQACNIDFLAAGSQKWLLSAPGSGFLYCRRDLLPMLIPGAYVGAASVVDSSNYLDYNLTYPENALRFGIGTPNIMGTVALHATLGLLQEVTIERISERILQLVGLLIDDLQQRGYTLSASTAPEHRSGIVVANVPAGVDADAVCKAMQQEGVVVTARGGGVRIAPHFYNTEDEVLAVGQLLDRTIATL